MDHATQLVDIVDEDGAVLSTKPRKEIDKVTDLFHTILVLVVTTDGTIVLGKIPERTDLPNLYSHKLGTPAGTIRRHNETADAAAVRVARRELHISDPKPEKLGESYEVFTNGSRRYITLYRIVDRIPDDFSQVDVEELQSFSPDELRQRIREQPDSFAPTFLRMWQKYCA